MYWFQLWREFKLSIAEIVSVFPDAEIIWYEKDVLLLQNIEQEDILKKASKLWWTIKIFEIIKLHSLDDYLNQIFSYAEFHEWKYRYGLSILWEKQNLKKLLMKVKKFLRAEKISSRFINKDFKNLSSAQIIWEKLVERGSDFTLISLPLSTKDGTGGQMFHRNISTKIKTIFYLGKTLWIQDIAAYSQRDYAKSRDMQVGMLPPKLSQIMINLASSPLLIKEGVGIIYDPFVWLWTILIEAQLMWFTGIYGSDLNEKMVELAQKNVFNNSPSLQGRGLGGGIEKLNAKFIHEASFWEEVKDWIIVTEWYLWEVMTKKNISKERILEQAKGLLKIYEAFFENLQKWCFNWIIVISFPFWEMPHPLASSLAWRRKATKYFYFEEIYEVLEKYCEILPYFSEVLDIQTTKSWSLLYKREKQLVGREIFRLKIKS